MEQADGVRAAADAGDDDIGQAAFLLQHLRARLGADHRLEVAHHGRIGMRTGSSADQVISVFDIGDPVAQRLVHGVLERAVPALTGRTSAPSSFMRKTLGFCRSTSVAPM
jgi:hypothetical protein